MRRRTFTAVAAISVGLIVAFPTYGVNWRQLRYAPVNYFTESDWSLFKETAIEVLENRKVGTMTEWENPETGHRGSFTLLTRFELEGQPCGKVKIFNSANGFTGESVFNLCKTNEGEWKIAQ